MANIRKILAKNMKEQRVKLGLTQTELAERANISTNFVAMIELMHKFPAPGTLDRIAMALEVETPMLFSAPPSPNETLERLYRSILADLDYSIEKAVDKAFDKRCTKNKKA